MKKLLVLIFCVLSAPLAQAQNWSGIIAPSRAARWDQNAGLPATFFDGETTTNAWTPPTRTQCGATVAAGTSFATINSRIAGCAAGTYVLLGAGNFSSSSTGIKMANNVTLRGSGADQTFLSCTGSCAISFPNTSGQQDNTWTGGLSQGSTSLTFGSHTGFSVGQLVVLYGIGSTTDNGGIYVCSNTGPCSLSGGNGNQSQTAVISSCDGNSTFNHSCSSNTVTISPGVYMPNWASGISSPLGTWIATSWSEGLEDVSVDFTGNSNTPLVDMGECYACWAKGDRFIGGSGTQTISTKNSARLLIANNYWHGGSTTVAPASVTMDTDSDILLINNFTVEGTFYSQGAGAGDVQAYNYLRENDSNTGSTAYATVIVDHESGTSYFMLEGNELGEAQFDLDHGTQNLDTVFRNLLTANEAPYTSSGNIQAIGFQGAARFMNSIGNVLGSNTTTAYACTPSSCPGGNPIYFIGIGPGGGPTDTLSVASSYRWGNFDVVSNAVRWCGNSSDPGWSTTCSSTSEVPTALSGNAAPYGNPVPSSTTLPASLFMPTTSHPNGGTGLSWWQVCTNYPTCSTTKTQPFPPIGPDVTGGGPVIGYTSDRYAGHAYDIPAAIAWKTLPIDTSYQGTYTITGQSFGSGTETLTVSGLPAGIKGEFQISGGPCSGTYVMNNSDSGHVMYAAASNPGTCSSGTFKWPDVRQFNETVYELDSNSSTGLAPPTGLTVSIQ